MTISVSCNCGEVYHVSHQLAGREIWCKVCGRTLPVPKHTAKELDTLAIQVKEPMSAFASESRETIKTKPHLTSPATILREDWSNVRNGLHIIYRGNILLLWFLLSVNLPLVLITLSMAFVENMSIRPAEQREYFPMILAAVAVTAAFTLIGTILLLAEELLSIVLICISVTYVLIVFGLKLPVVLPIIGLGLAGAALYAIATVIAGLGWCAFGARSHRSKQLAFGSLGMTCVSFLIYCLLASSMVTEISEYVSTFQATRTLPSAVPLSNVTKTLQISLMISQCIGHLLLGFFLIEVVLRNSKDVSHITNYLYFAAGTMACGIAFSLLQDSTDSVSIELLLMIASILSLEIVRGIWFIKTLRTTHYLVAESTRVSTPLTRRPTSPCSR